MLAKVQGIEQLGFLMPPGVNMGATPHVILGLLLPGNFRLSLAWLSTILPWLVYHGFLPF